MNNSEKQCKCCKIVKTITNFPIAKYADGREWYRGTCKDCKNKKASIYYAQLNEEKKETLRESARERAEKNGSWLKPSLTVQRPWTESEYHFNIKQAKKLKRCKLYFKYSECSPEDTVSDAYIRMVEKELPYSRYQFYLLMWGSMAMDKYWKIKSNPSKYNFYLKCHRERKAIGRFLMQRWYLDTLNRAKGIDTETLISEDYRKQKEYLNIIRKEKVLEGEVLLTNTQSWG